MPLSQLDRLDQLVRTGQYAQAMKAFLGLLRDSTLTRKQLALAYHCASVVRFQMEELFSAVELGKMAEENAIAAGDEVLLGRIWSNMIAFFRRIGDTAKALEYGEKWLANLALYPELARQEGKVQYNLALVYRSRRNNSKSLQHFRTAIAAMERDGMPRSVRAAALQMHAWVLYEQGRITEGDAQREAVDGLIEEDDQAAVREQILLRCLRAYQTQDYRAVLDLAEEFLLPGAPSTTIQQFWASWMAGFVAARLGQEEPAKAMCLLARDYAMKTKLTEHMNRACELDAFVRQHLKAESAG